MELQCEVADALTGRIVVQDLLLRTVAAVADGLVRERPSFRDFLHGREALAELLVDCALLFELSLREIRQRALLVIDIRDLATARAMVFLVHELDRDVALRARLEELVGNSLHEGIIEDVEQIVRDAGWFISHAVTLLS